MIVQTAARLAIACPVAILTFEINKNDVFLPFADQREVPENTYKRKIIIATAIAEASLTIDTLKYMVNILKTKSNIYDPNEKLGNR